MPPWETTSNPASHLKACSQHCPLCWWVQLCPLQSVADVSQLVLQRSDSIVLIADLFITYWRKPRYRRRHLGHRRCRRHRRWYGTCFYLHTFEPSCNNCRCWFPYWFNRCDQYFMAIHHKWRMRWVIFSSNQHRSIWLLLQNSECPGYLRCNWVQSIMIEITGKSL